MFYLCYDEEGREIVLPALPCPACRPIMKDKQTIMSFAHHILTENQIGVGVDIFVRITLIGQLADIFTCMVAAELQERQTNQTVRASS